MARGRRGLERPPWWAIVVMVAGLLFLAVGLPIALHRPAPAAGASAPDQGTALVSDSAGNTQATTRVLVIGDSYTGGSAQGGNGNNGWARLAATDLIGKGYQFQMTIHAAGGAGYTEPNATGTTQVKLAQQSGGPYNLVIFFGSRNDDATTTDVRSAAASAYAAIKRSSPTARLLVVGPPWVNSDPPAFITADRDQVEAAAKAAGADFVDPLAEGWFAGQYASLIGTDHVHPTNAGHQHMADLIEPHIQQELAALGAAPK